ARRFRNSGGIAQQAADCASGRIRQLDRLHTGEKNNHAADTLRVKLPTRVQTRALPWAPRGSKYLSVDRLSAVIPSTRGASARSRSEERRVGKEGKSRRPAKTHEQRHDVATMRS